MAFVDIIEREEDRPKVDNVWHTPWEHDALLFSVENTVPRFSLSYNNIRSTSV